MGARRRLAAALGVAFLATLGCGGPDADLVVLGGRIVTVDDGAPEAEALAARDGRLVAVGAEADVRRMIGPDTVVVELEEGMLAVPGLVDAHAHFLGVGHARMQLDLTVPETWGEGVAAVASEASRRSPGEWIRGRGWHQEKWREAPADAVGGMPVHDALSAAAPDNPVLLVHASGHAAIVNAAALELAGIDDDTPDPPGGEIVRDGRGRATGVLRETAEGLVAAVMDVDATPGSVRRAAALAGQACVEHGLTAMHDAGTTLAELEVLEAMAAAGELPVRLWVMLSEDDGTLARALPGAIVHRAGGGFLTVGGIKRYLDGALGAHGAWLLEPYEDMPRSTGLAVTSPEALAASGRLARAHGLQLCTHAIGDRANRVALDVYREVLAEAPAAADHRWRVEHAQHLRPDDVPRFAELGVVASMQPVHCTSDGPWVPSRLGGRRAAEGAYMWRSLLDSGAVIAAGTDAPVEPVDPLATFAAAVTRRMASGELFHPGQAMTRQEALRAMTLDAAWAAFEDDVAGSLEVGKYADLTVLSRDILQVPEEVLRDTAVVATIVAGRVAYRR